MAQTEFSGVGFAVRQVFSGIEGGFGLGFVLGTNLTLDVQTDHAQPLLRNTLYLLSYPDPATGTTRTVGVVHDPDVPYQGKLPENVPLTFTLPDSVFYEALTVEFLIPTAAVRVVRVRAKAKTGKYVKLRYYQ